ncbi:hypothetical protein BD289DRAFT_109597 [Coniella lustricola]|uniref:Uncharacterized protein n=1 Tax=Coniella lustricola TaxID=2025994 RepID=A0A2T2ZXE3_9PEZI|nr:hypothetical protein BD289DRAFT_109597 [Coniella lustricola]
MTRADSDSCGCNDRYCMDSLSRHESTQAPPHRVGGHFPSCGCSCHPICVEAARFPHKEASSKPARSMACCAPRMRATTGPRGPDNCDTSFRHTTRDYQLPHPKPFFFCTSLNRPSLWIAWSGTQSGLACVFRLRGRLTITQTWPCGFGCRAFLLLGHPPARPTTASRHPARPAPLPTLRPLCPACFFGPPRRARRGGGGRRRGKWTCAAH